MEGCRAASRADLPRIVELARGLRREIRDIRGGPLWATHEGLAEPLDAAYGELLDDELAHLLVGTIDDAAIGFAAGRVDRLHDDSALGVILDLYVEPEARGIGVGEALVDELVDWFGGHGCVGVDAWALPGHRMTKNFFEGHGFVSRGIVVHRPLGDPGPPS